MTKEEHNKIEKDLRNDFFKFLSDNPTPYLKGNVPAIDQNGFFLTKLKTVYTEGEPFSLFMILDDLIKTYYTSKLSTKKNSYIVIRSLEITPTMYDMGNYGTDKPKPVRGIIADIKYVYDKEPENMKNKSPKLLIIGHARHGKDSLAELLNEEFGLKFKSSSQAAADIFIYDTLKEQYGYKTPEECFTDRMNHRAEWYQMICDYNKDDKARLAKDILTLTDCYVGMRDRGEITECIKQGLFDLIIWVDASNRLPLESPDSFNIDKSCADIIVDNNGSFQDFKSRVSRLGKIILGKNLTDVEIVSKFAQTT